VSGDLDQPVSLVHFAVDPTLAVIDEARAASADLLVTHHPLLLRGVHSVATSSAKGASVTALIVNHIALYVGTPMPMWPHLASVTPLASACALVDVGPLDVNGGTGFGRVGSLAYPLTLREFANG